MMVKDVKIVMASAFTRDIIVGVLKVQTLKKHENTNYDNFNPPCVVSSKVSRLRYVPWTHLDSNYCFHFVCLPKSMESACKVKKIKKNDVTNCRR